MESLKVVLLIGGTVSLYFFFVFVDGTVRFLLAERSIHGRPSRTNASKHRGVENVRFAYQRLAQFFQSISPKP